MKTVLTFIADSMKEMGISYHLLRNRSRSVACPYFVGEIFPEERADESGIREYTMLLTGFDRGEDITPLLEKGEKITEYFPSVEGRTAVTGRRSIAVFSSEPEPLDSGEENLQKLQISLKIKEWRGSE